MQNCDPMRRNAKAKVKQACDSCRARKIRCDGACPCANCTSISLQCTFLSVHKKTGPKGKRRRWTYGSSIVPAPRPSVQAYDGSYSMDSTTSPNSCSADSTMRSPGSQYPAVDILGVEDTCLFQPSTRLPIDFMSLCMDAWFKYKYPITPVLDQEQIKTALPLFTTSPELYSLLASCCANVVLSPGTLHHNRSFGSSPGESVSSSSSKDTATSESTAGMPTAQFLISEAKRARQYYPYTEYPTLHTVQTSFFLYAAHFCLGEDSSAWFHLREAITLLQLLRLHEESTYASLLASDPVTAVYGRRMFWVLFITERAYALQRNRVLTLQTSIALPSADSESGTHVLQGFLNLISLFRNFDEQFVTLWNHSSAPNSTSETSLVKLQNVLAYALPVVSGCTQEQLADLLVSREWLKTIVWQLCVSRAMLSSSSNEESMSIRYPISIARDVVLVSRLISTEAFEANGVGILEKIFDIGCSLSDVLSLDSSIAQPSTLEVGPRDCLVELVRIVGSFGYGFKNLQILASKAASCLRTSIDRPLLTVEDDFDDYSY